MNASLPIDIAEAILWFHVVVIAFNVFGLVAIPLGAWSGWKFVRVFWWRALHLGLLGIVALQAVLGRACFLTIWESDLQRRAGEAASNEPLIRRWVSQAIYWPLPLWFFAMLYVLRFHGAVVVACPSAVPSAWPVSVGPGAVRAQ